MKTKQVLVPIQEGNLRAVIPMNVSEQCLSCKHLKLGKQCDAFDSIPDDIFSGKFDHKKKYSNERFLYERNLRVNLT